MKLSNSVAATETSVNANGVSTGGPFPLRLPMHPALMSNVKAEDEGCINDMILQQSESLQQIFMQTQRLMAEVDQVSDHLKTMNKTSQTQKSIDERAREISVMKDLKALYESPNSPFSIKLSYPIGQIFYKNKPFQLKLRISEKSGEEIGRVSLVVKVFAYESPIKEIVHSYKGEAILINGRAKEVDGHEIIKFKRICFTEVSKKYPSEKFILVVLALGRNDIAPLIIDGIQVKSRSPRA
ncbi:unnamed protein product [Blepharisma stoltei]|uniref:Uncharacterized protein n=1 Tax=Blepharisma stoltei TaxID=1481888 RepID=A0AAU9K7T2_9CILI|nr:unnamed protein product [Blepharisma stoltei]